MYAHAHPIAWAFTAVAFSLPLIFLGLLILTTAALVIIVMAGRFSGQTIRQAFWERGIGKVIAKLQKISFLGGLASTGLAAAIYLLTGIIAPS